MSRLRSHARQIKRNLRSVGQSLQKCSYGHCTLLHFLYYTSAAIFVYIHAVRQYALFLFYSFLTIHFYMVDLTFNRVEISKKNPGCCRPSAHPKTHVLYSETMRPRYTPHFFAYILHICIRPFSYGSNQPIAVKPNGVFFRTS